MGDTGEQAMVMLGEDQPGFRQALDEWRADCARFGNPIEWRDAISFLRGWKAARALEAAVEAALQAVTPPLNFELRPDGTEDPQSAAYVQGVGEVVMAVRRAIAR